MGVNWATVGVLLVMLMTDLPQSKSSLQTRRRLAGGSPFGLNRFFPGLAKVTFEWRLNTSHRYTRICSGTVPNEFTILLAGHCFVPCFSRGYSNATFDCMRPVEVSVAVKRSNNVTVCEADLEPHHMFGFIHPAYLHNIADESELIFSTLKSETTVNFVPLFSLEYQNQTSFFVYQSPRYTCTRDGDIGGALIREDRQTNKTAQVGVISSSYCDPQCGALDYFVALGRKKQYLSKYINYTEIVDANNTSPEPFCGMPNKLGNDTENEDSQHLWLMSLFDASERYMCHATYIGSNSVITAEKCITEGSRPVAIGGVFEMAEKYLMSQTGSSNHKHYCLLNIRNDTNDHYVVNKRRRHVILTFSEDLILTDHFYLRPVCLQSVQTGNQGMQNLTSVGWQRTIIGAVDDVNNMNYFYEPANQYNIYKRGNTIQSMFRSIINGILTDLANLPLGNPLLLLEGTRYVLKGVRVNGRMSVNDGYDLI